MEWTAEEVRVLDDLNLRKMAVSSVLTDLMANGGRVDVSGLSKQQIDYIIYLLRDLRAVLR